ncbi:MAG TPA: DUF1549 domain-containing protein [Gemmataceae bacterium]|nr:DUF1549 domain-containing protein [Gemmataceae bacterium]
MFFGVASVRADDTPAEAKAKAKLLAQQKAEAEKSKRDEGKNTSASIAIRVVMSAAANSANVVKRKVQTEKPKTAEELKKEAEAKRIEEEKKAAQAKAAEAMLKERLAKMPTAPLTKKIDEAIAKKLEEEKLPASPKADDAEFLRRVYLDLTGVIPNVEKTKAFLDDKDPNKRAKLIDELLASPVFGKHEGDVWTKLMFQRLTENRGIRVDPLREWLEDRFVQGESWDKIVTGLLTATGTQEENGASTYFLAALSADKMTDSISRLFLGVKIECAQCHNHPFVSYKQNDYWALAAFFMKVRLDGNPKNPNPKGRVPSIVEISATQGKGVARQKNLPEAAKFLPPKFLKGEQANVEDKEPLRPVFAKWLTEKENPYFGRAWANRVWGQLFGVGIINPIDDMHEERVPSHPELLDELAKVFVAQDFDVRFLYRAICNSETYQRTSIPVAGNEADRTYFSHMPIKVLTAEQLYDSLNAVVSVANLGREIPKDKAAAFAAAQKRGALTARDQFVAFFDAGETQAISYESGIPQVLRLMNSPQYARGASLVAQNLTRGLAKDQAIEKLYLTAFSRRPTSAEMEKMTKYVDDHPTDGFGDILWVLLNSSEFALNR